MSVTVSRNPLTDFTLEARAVVTLTSFGVFMHSVKLVTDSVFAELGNVRFRKRTVEVFNVGDLCIIDDFPTE